MKQIILKELRLSENPSATVAEVKGETVNTDSNGKPYCIGVFQEYNNPFSIPSTRMIRLDSLKMSDLAKMVGKVVPGASIVTVDTEPYAIGERTAHKYTVCIIEGLRETLDSVLTAQGIVRKGAASATVATPAEPVAEEKLPL